MCPALHYKLSAAAVDWSVHALVSLCTQGACHAADLVAGSSKEKALSSTALAVLGRRLVRQIGEPLAAAELALQHDAQTRSEAAQGWRTATNWWHVTNMSCTASSIITKPT